MKTVAKLACITLIFCTTGYLYSAETTPLDLAEETGDTKQAHTLAGIGKMPSTEALFTAIKNIITDTNSTDDAIAACIQKHDIDVNLPRCICPLRVFGICMPFSTHYSPLCLAMLESNAKQKQRLCNILLLAGAKLSITHD